LTLPAVKSASNELSTVLVSNNTVKNIIVEMSENVKEQLILNIKINKFYSSQLD